MSWLPKQKIVVPVDFSEDSFNAVDAALEMVAAPAALHIVYVLPVFDPAEPDVVWSTVNDETRRRHGEQALRERLAGPKYQGLNFHVLFGEPGHKITELAASEKAELIVLSSHGRTGISRLLIGSVAEKVVRLAHCPVLVLRK
ncbi:MAG TPA: universal stress protein [Pirellulales bacterium]|nr:universal stress protein [Pirellulales bacterium]